MHSAEQSFREQSVFWLTQLKKKHLRLELAALFLWSISLLMFSVAVLSVLFSFRVNHYAAIGSLLVLLASGSWLLWYRFLSARSERKELLFYARVLEKQDSKFQGRLLVTVEETVGASQEGTSMLSRASQAQHRSTSVFPSIFHLAYSL